MGHSIIPESCVPCCKSFAKGLEISLGCWFQDQKVIVLHGRNREFQRGGTYWISPHIYMWKQTQRPWFFLPQRYSLAWLQETKNNIRHHDFFLWDHGPGGKKSARKKHLITIPCTFCCRHVWKQSCKLLQESPEAKNLSSFSLGRFSAAVLNLGEAAVRHIWPHT